MSFWWSSVYQWRIFPSAAAMEKYESVFWVTLLKSSVEQQCQSGALNTLNSLHFTAALHKTCSSWIRVTSDAAVSAWIIEKCIFQSKHTVIIQSDLLLAKTSRNSLQRGRGSNVFFCLGNRIFTSRSVWLILWVLQVDVVFRAAGRLCSYSL